MERQTIKFNPMDDLEPTGRKILLLHSIRGYMFIVDTHLKYKLEEFGGEAIGWAEIPRAVTDGVVWDVM